MAYVPIPKDLDKIKTKVAFNLTKRQLIGFSVAGLIGIPTYLFMKKYLPNDVSIIVFSLIHNKFIVTSSESIYSPL